jgi:UDP-2,3-diacylglucosamine pyrophosphatase LpxH
MSKHSRLTEVFQKARRIQFNDSSRIIFFSDVHRGDNSWADDFARNQTIYTYALNHYYDAGFTYVEVGDGDELMKNDSVRAIRHAHATVYRLIRDFFNDGRFYFIFGNHDVEYAFPEFQKKYLHNIYNEIHEREEPLFPGITVHEGLVFQHEETNSDLFVVHGHQGEIINDRQWWISRLFLRRLWRPLQLLGLQDPTSISANPTLRRRVENQITDWVVQNDQPVICGHTHQARFPKNNEPPYFNSGSCVHPRWISGIEIDNGLITLVRWRIRTKKKGTLYVKRDIAGGPTPLTKIFRHQHIPAVAEVA